MKLRTLLLASLLTCAAIDPASAKFAMPMPTPIDRIIKNTEAKLEKTPDDTELRYQLARVHYLAYTLKTSSLGVFTRGEPTAAEVSTRFQEKGQGATALDVAGAQAHAQKAAALYQEVLKKEPKHALANLGFASLLQEYFKETSQGLTPSSSPAVIRGHYAAAFESAYAEEKNARHPGIDGLKGFVSHEAAQGFLESAKGDAALTDEEKKTAQAMEAAIEKFKSLGMGPITPLVFSLQPAPSIASLLAPERAVRFDLRGFGAAERWPWVQAETAILVWDPAGEGRITSARQMFGSYSWQLFWKTGFDALAALDDNQDGWLRGAELDGLSVWRDRNQNAVSDPGEVTPLSMLGVIGLACTAPESEGIHPLHRQGVEMNDGRKLPLWDWTTSPLQTEPVAAR